MTPNVGTADRVIRLVLGTGLILGSILGYVGPWGWLGLIVLVTGLFRTCPAYMPFGLSTCRRKPQG